jgi:ribosomal protein S18 acetylase RimI-like enzyme
MDFLFCVFVSSRFEEMALLTSWTDEQKDSFLYSQFLAQHGFYHKNYPKARYDIITANAIKIGRFYVARMKDEIRIMDITLLPPFRNFGVGNLLITQLMTEAQSNGQFISLHVEESNCAKELYDRMGFVEVRDISLYKLMHWYPLT